MRSEGNKVAIQHSEGLAGDESHVVMEEKENWYNVIRHVGWRTPGSASKVVLVGQKGNRKRSKGTMVETRRTLEPGLGRGFGKDADSKLVGKQG